MLFYNRLLLAENFFVQEIYYPINNIFLLLHFPIQFIIQNELQKKDFKRFAVFCLPEIAAIIKEIGFSYYNDDPSGVLLFEKHL